MPLLSLMHYCGMETARNALGNSLAEHFRSSKNIYIFKQFLPLGISQEEITPSKVKKKKEVINIRMFIATLFCHREKLEPI